MDEKERAPEDLGNPRDLGDILDSGDLQALLELANAKMPFGKYAGMYLVDLPETYVLWFKGKGYPEGKLGEQLRAIEEIKTNGLECLVKPLCGKTGVSD